MDEMPARIDRRAALKWMLAAAGYAVVGPRGRAAAGGAGAPSGYGLDPDLLKSYRPGDCWPLTFSPEERRLAVVLCDLIIPADEVSPGASTVGTHDFVDEWISAPYPTQAADRHLILKGFAWLDEQAARSGGRKFADLDPAAQRAICDPICYAPKAGPELAEPAKFFARLRDVVAGGFYTTPEGMRDIGYVGNRPSATFDGPDAEILRRVGLA